VSDRPRPRRPAHRGSPERPPLADRPVAPVAERPALAAPRPAPSLPAGAVLLLAALGIEARALRRALPGAVPLGGEPGWTPVAGFTWPPPGSPPPGSPPPGSPASGRAVVVLQVGLGAGALGRPGVVQAIRAARPVAILSVGFAGGLEPSLRVGDIVLGEPVLEPTVSGHWWPAAGLATQAAIAARRAHVVLHAGPVLSVSRVETTPAAKAALAFGSPAVAIDMESARVARAAAELAVPFLAVRVISDAAGDRLPDEPWRLLTPDDAPLRHAIRYVLRRPRSLPTLIRTGLRARRASAVLTAFAAAWLAEIG
jgi:adenosylhomocysteine nucleosidase